MREMTLEAIRSRFENAEWDHADVEWFYKRAQRGYWVEIQLAKLWDHVISCPKCGAKMKLQELKQSESKFAAIQPAEANNHGRQ